MDIKIIHLAGVDTLKERQKQLVNRLLNEYYPRIQRQLKNFTSFEVDIKNYKKEGKQKKFSINLKVVVPTRIFKANAIDWDLARALHNVLNKIMNEIESKMHSSNQHSKIRRLQKNRERK